MQAERAEGCNRYMQCVSLDVRKSVQDEKEWDLLGRWSGITYTEA